MRIVAGDLGGRRLRRPGGSQMRPTADRARATLFDWLGVRALGGPVLDLFAGTGAVGIEALSRGADTATFVECARGSVRVLRQNLETLELAERGTVLMRDVRQALPSLARRGLSFRVVFADPPYDRGWVRWLTCEAKLAALLEPTGWLVIERSRREPAGRSDPGLRLRDTRTCGETAFDLYEPVCEPAA